MTEDTFIRDDITDVNINKLGESYPYLTMFRINKRTGTVEWSSAKDYYFIDNKWFSLGNMVNMHPSQIEKYVNLLYEEMKSKNKNSIFWGGSQHAIYTSDQIKKSAKDYFTFKPEYFAFSTTPFEPPKREKTYYGYNTHHKKSSRKNSRKQYVNPEAMF